MSAQARRSIGRAAPVSGFGLHTGAPATLTFRPAPAGHGVAFYRTDLAGQPRIPASLSHVVAVDRRTALCTDGARVETVEHVLAAVAGHGIDDVRIELDGPEAPIADGSAAPYFRALADAGIAPVGGAPDRVTLRATLEVREGDATYVASPCAGLRLTVTIDWPHPLIGRQTGTFEVTPDRFASELAPARTFGFLEEAADLEARGLARGAAGDRLLVLTRDGLESGELRWPDEFVRHKATDLLGDLQLLGARFEGEIVAHRPSHKGNLALARAISTAAETPAAPALDITRILETLPHRYPMLLVDRILELEPGKRVVGIKNVTINEPFFQGHFPGQPVMPGVLIIEAMGQAGGTLLMGSVENPEKKLVYFVGIDDARFRRVVVPGDQLRMEVELLQLRGATVRMQGKAFVEGQLAAEAQMLARIVDR